MIPSIGRPPRLSPTSVPNSGRPATKDLVPSIGSRCQTSSASGALGAELLARDAMLGVARPDQRAHGRSASRSAMVTGLASSLLSTATGSTEVAFDDRGGGIGKLMRERRQLGGERLREAHEDAAQPPSGKGSGLSDSERR